MSVNPLTPRPLRMPGFSGVASGQTASVQLPVGGPTYHSVFINYAVNAVAATSAQIDALRLRLKINGTTVYETTGALERLLNAYYGHAHVDGVLPIFFARPTARTPNMDQMTAIGTAFDVSQLTLEIDIPTVTAPTLSLEAEVSDIRRPVNYIIRRSISLNRSLAAGQSELTDFPTSTGDLIGMHIQGANVTGCDILLNGRPVIEATPFTLTARHLITCGGRVPQTNFVHIDPCARDTYNARVPLTTPQGNDLRVRPTLSGAGTANFVIDTLFAPFPLRPEPQGIA